MADDEKEYTIAASEALMIDYCNFVTTLLNSDGDSDNEKERKEALPSVAVAINDTGTGIDEAVDTIADPQLQLTLFFGTLHKDSDRLYTEKQRLLNLPLPLMVAATLSDLATAEGEATPDARNTLFQRLQRVWMEKQHELFNQPKPRRRLQKNRANQIRYFEWSPTLLLSLQPIPMQNHSRTGTIRVQETSVMVASDDQRTTNDTGTSANGSAGTAGCQTCTFSAPSYIAESLQMHLIRRRDELMEQASLAQQQLFLLEATAVAKRKKIAKSQSQSNCDRKKPTIEPQLVNTDTLDTDMDSHQQDSTDDDDDDAKSGNGNIDLVVTRNTGNNHWNEDICGDALSIRSQFLTEDCGDWKDVHVRRKIPAASNRTDEEVDDTIYDVPVPRNSSVNAASIVPISNTESADSENVDYSQNSPINNHTPQLPMPMLLDTINDLKMQLQQMHQQRIAEQQSAQKALQHERDVSYERIQALQLRLYISETRLQTYEEALQHHVESVHQNIAITPTSMKDLDGNVVATSGNMQTQPETDLSAVGTPLYARRATEETTTNRLIISDG